MPRHSIKNLRAVHVFDVPLREVSGICLRRGRKRKMSLIAVGDRAATIACLALPPPDMSSLEWDTIDVADFGGTHLSHKGSPNAARFSHRPKKRRVLVAAQPARWRGRY